MVTIEFKLPFGRYGAAPWEGGDLSGQVEFPPSPWRIFRAMYSSFYATQSKADPDKFGSIIELLAAQPPSYTLPDRVEYGQSRHYYPSYSYREQLLLDKGVSLSSPKRRKGIEAWVSVSGPIYLHFDAILSEDQKELLRQVVSQISYLGRSEYPVECSITSDPPEPNYLPDPSGTDLVAVAVPLKQLTAELQLSPQEFRARGLMGPVSRRLIAYQRLSLASRQLPKVFRVERPIKQATWAIALPKGHKAEGLFLASKLHETLVSKLPESATFRGRSEGKASQSALWIWTERLSDSDAVLIHAGVQGHLTEKEIAVLRQSKRLYFKGSSEPHQLILLSATADSPWEPATTWRSATPFVLGAHPKKLELSPGVKKQCPEHQAIVSVCQQLKVDLEIDSLRRSDTGAVAAKLSDGSELSVQVLRSSPIGSEWAIRGDRQAAIRIGFEIEISSSVPLILPAIGFGSRFGAGRLIPTGG